MSSRNTPALRKLSDVVNSYLNLRGDYSKEDYNRFLQIVIEGYTDLNIHHTLSVKTLVTRVNDANMIALEPDFIDWARIGVVIQGIYYPIGVNENITLPADDICVFNPSIPEHSNQINITSYQDYSAEGGKRFAEFKVFRTERKIQFRGSIKNYDILIDYISSGINMEEDTFVSVEMIPVLRAYLKWQLLNYNDAAGLGQKQFAANLYGYELDKLVAFQNSLSAEEFLDIIRSGYKQTLKR